VSTLGGERAAQSGRGSQTWANSDVVVVGISVNGGSSAALQWAAQEAERRSATVRAVMAWHPSGLPGGAPGRPTSQRMIGYDQAQMARDKLEEYVEDALGPDSGVECRAIEGSPERVLLEQAHDAALLVVDSPRLAKLLQPRARRLAPRLIFRSPCPVLVLPPPAPTPQAQQAAAERDDSVAAPAGISG